MNPLLPWFILGSVLALFGTAGGAYWKGKIDGRAAEFAERATLEEVAKEAREAAILASGEQIAKITVNHTTIRQRAETVTREVPIYRDCVNDPAVVRLLDAARADRPPAESSGPGVVPGTRADFSQ